MTAIRCKVLLVDDDGMLLGALARLLSTAFDVATASTLGEARAALVQSMPHVRITDLNLGGGERGEDLLQFVATSHPAVVRVAFSGSPDALAAVRASGLAQVLQEKVESNSDALLLSSVRCLPPGPSEPVRFLPACSSSASGSPRFSGSTVRRLDAGRSTSVRCSRPRLAPAHGGSLGIQRTSASRSARPMERTSPPQIDPSSNWCKFYGTKT